MPRVISPARFRLLTCALVAAVAVTLVAPPLGPRHAAAQEPGNPFFARVWMRTDQMVASTEVARTWVWGPRPFTGQVGEAYADAPGGTRIVQYFDKSRMEINDPGWDAGDLWYVTNGLLARELITGQMQVGDNAFIARDPAQINIAGDPDDPSAPTYASFTGLLGTPPLAEGAAVTQVVERDGAVTCCVPDDHAVRAGPLVPETGHRVASVFWEYLNSSGRIIERERRTTGALFANPYYATGYPIGEPYWAQARVKGLTQWVLVQPFERRVLTFTPSNAPGWQVEMGNVGRHYYDWRYATGAPGAAPDWQLPPVPRWIPAGQEVAIPETDAHYTLHLTDVNVATGAVTVRQQIRIDRLHSPRPASLYLQVVPAQYGFFTLDRMTLNGQAISPVRHFNGVSLEVPLGDTPLPLTLDIDFRLQVGRESTGWGGTSLDAGILRLGYFFPIISDLHGYSDTLDASQAQVADFTVTIDVDPAVVVAHAGEEVGRETLPDGRRRLHLAAQDMRDFALVLARGFQVTERTAPSGVRLTLYIHPSSESSVSNEVAAYRRQIILNAAEDAIEQLGRLVGPYTYGRLAIVDAGPTMPGGLEFPGLIYINPAYNELDRLIYHEVAHQWMHAMIGNRTLIDGWIDEGGAEFFERGLPTRFTERPMPPPGGYRYWLDSTYQEIVYDASRQWYYSIYEQGARFYYAVMDRMGWDAFWRAFQALYANHLYDIVTASDVLATFQEHSPTDLRPLYREYFRYPWIDELLPHGG